MNVEYIAKLFKNVINYSQYDNASKLDVKAFKSNMCAYIDSNIYAIGEKYKRFNQEITDGKYKLFYDVWLGYHAQAAAIMIVFLKQLSAEPNFSNNANDDAKNILEWLAIKAGLSVMLFAVKNLNDKTKVKIVKYAKLAIYLSEQNDTFQFQDADYQRRWMLELNYARHEDNLSLPTIAKTLSQIEEYNHQLANNFLTITINN
jgi:hypothetical protein